MNKRKSNTVVGWLRRQLNTRQENNPSYSLRAFARDLRLSPSYVSQIFSEQKALSTARAVQMAEALNLSFNDKEQLLALVNGSVVKREVDESNLQEQELFRHWYVIATMDLLSTESNEEKNVKWIAKRLCITTLQAREAIDTLLALKLIEPTDDGYKKSDQFLNLATRASHVGIRNYHSSMIHKALDFLESRHSEPFEARDISGITFAINTSKIAEAKKIIEECKSKLRDALTEGPCTELYQFNVQFFQLTTGKPVKHMEIK